MKKMVYVVLALCVLTGCSRYSSNGETLYLQSRNGEKVVVPPPLTSEHISHFYDLPPQNDKAEVSIVPPEVDAQS